MSNAKQSTALLFFSRSLEEEVRNKALLQNDIHNFYCINSLRLHSLSVAKKSGLPVFNYPEHQQRGDSFGERISNAFQDLFDLGFTNVISVGNDCPDISVSDINKSNEQLGIHSAVLGPDQRGGAFLIGLSSKAFDKNAFAQLDWQTNHLISSFRNYTELLGIKEIFIGQKIDLNTKEDIVGFATVSKNLSSILAQIFIVRCAISFYMVAYYKVVNVGLYSKRGPPEVIVFQ